MQLILVRHGQSEPNSTTPDWRLSARGAWEGRRVGERLIGAGITHILSSPLLRALATAHIIAEAINHQSIEVWVDLREGFDRDYAGPGRAELHTQFPRATLPEEMSDGEWIYSGDTGESFVARCHAVLDRLMARFGPDDRVLVVTHGGLANYLLHAVLRLPQQAPVWFEMANGALTTLRFVPERERTIWPLYPEYEVEMISLNNTDHLSEQS